MKPKFVDSMQDLVQAAVGDRVTLRCKTEAAPAASLRWFKDNKELRIFESSRFCLLILKRVNPFRQNCLTIVFLIFTVLLKGIE